MKLNRPIRRQERKEKEEKEKLKIKKIPAGEIREVKTWKRKVKRCCCCVSGHVFIKRGTHTHTHAPMISCTLAEKVENSTWISLQCHISHGQILLTVCLAAGCRGVVCVDQVGNRWASGWERRTRQTGCSYHLQGVKKYFCLRYWFGFTGRAICRQICFLLIYRC